MGLTAPWVAVLVLCALVLAVYGQVGSHSFVNLDDPYYVYENQRVLGGLTWDGFSWAFRGFHLANWHPLTWLSHMADVRLFGVDAGRHLIVNVAFHLANTVVLFLVLRAATARIWESAFVAALFAVHPLHVESVAWVSERKDVLSTFFWFLTMAAYIRYARRPGRGRYLWVVVWFALGLLAKPMLVTLPFTLMLMDRWPLQRLRREVLDLGVRSPELRRLVSEKVPLLLLSAVSCVVTYVAQAEGGAVVESFSIPLWPRIGNAIVSCVAYLGKTIWPSNLVALYPHPAIAGGGTPIWTVALSALVLGVISLAAFQLRRSQPSLAFGWPWYLGTLVPVIGIVQVGAQAMADRYTYVPLVGVFVAAVYGLADLGVSRRYDRRALGAAGIVFVLAFAWAGWKQTGHWRNSVTLHLHAIKVTERNWLAFRALGDAYNTAGRFQEGFAAHQEAIDILPKLAEAWHGLGVSVGQLGRHSEAIGFFGEALRINPRYVLAWNNLGWAHKNIGEYREASECFRSALQVRPDDPRAWANLGAVSVLLGDREQALASYSRLKTLDTLRAELLLRQIQAGATAQ